MAIELSERLFPHQKFNFKISMFPRRINLSMAYVASIEDSQYSSINATDAINRYLSQRVHLMAIFHMKSDRYGVSFIHKRQ